MAGSERRTGGRSAAAALALAALAAASAGAQDEAGLRHAIAAQAAAVAAGDRGTWLGSFGAVDAEFALERERWFDYRTETAVSDWRTVVEGLEWRSAGECVARLRTTYRVGGEKAPREVAEARLYAFSAGRWVDRDLAWSETRTEHWIVRYSPEAPASVVARAASEAERAWRLVRDGYGAAPDGRSVLKLYADSEVLRHDTKIGLARVFNGWAERGESVKLWLRPDGSWRPAATLAHELVHKVSLGESANLCSWFAEGLAMRYGSFPGFGGSYLDSGLHRLSDYDRPLAWLEGFDPDAVAAEGEWQVYCGMAEALVRTMEATWGPNAPHRLVLALAAWPQPAAGYVWKRDDAERRAWFYAALEKEFGGGREELEAAWRRRIEAGGPEG